jgi:hypothetical protein
MKKKMIAVGAVTIALLGAMPAPASAHIERGLNCHIIGRPEQLSNHRVKIRWRITNRTQQTRDILCVARVESDTHRRLMGEQARVLGRHFVERSTVARLPGTLESARVVHGHFV